LSQSWVFDYNFIKRTSPAEAVVKNLSIYPEFKKDLMLLHLLLTEAYENILDYQWLGLNGSDKRDPKGFVTYFAEKKHRVANLSAGELKIQVKHHPSAFGRIEVWMHLDLPSDIPSDFTFHLESYAARNAHRDSDTLSQCSGRGLQTLIKHCSSLFIEAKKGLFFCQIDLC
jgi:hypothetical protein